MGTVQHIKGVNSKMNYDWSLGSYCTLVQGGHITYRGAYFGQRGGQDSLAPSVGKKLILQPCCVGMGAPIAWVGWGLGDADSLQVAAAGADLFWVWHFHTIDAPCHLCRPLQVSPPRSRAARMPYYRRSGLQASLQCCTCTHGHIDTYFNILTISCI